MDISKIAKKVRKERERLGLSVRKFALKADMDPLTVTNVESGNHLPSLATIIKLAEATGKAPAWFLQ